METSDLDLSTSGRGVTTRMELTEGRCQPRRASLGSCDKACLLASFVQHFFSFWAASVAYGSSRAKGQIGAAAASLHNHCNTRSEPPLQPTPQLTAKPDPQPTEPRGELQETMLLTLILHVVPA